MKALTLTKYGSAKSAFEEQDLPTPSPQEGEVLIHVEAFGLNFADVLARLDLYQEAPNIPCVLGYEVVGTVEKVGSGVEESIIGTRVTAFTRFGGYAEYAVTKAAGLAEIGDMGAGKATALATQYCTAWYMACDRAFLRKGDAVLVHSAAGGVGTALTQILKQKGCVVFGTTGSDEKIQYLKDNGVDHPINYKTQDYAKEISKISDKKITTSFNAVGGKSFKKDMKLITEGGTVFTFGAASRAGKSGGFLANIGLLFSMGFTHPLFLLMQSKSIIGVNMLNVGDQQPEVLKGCIEGVVQWAKDGKLNPIVGKSYPSSELAQAHDDLENGNTTGKIVVKW
ncbi:MAG: zinc-binding dehydrogenase [Cytophagales bacterium]|nr:zinc-binding dehydrogenase [Cytophagales bacterium]